MIMEVEYKFYLPEDLSPETLREDPFWALFRHSPWTFYHMKADYYQDRQGLLRKHEVSLRLRMENEARILTVKKPKFLEGGLAERYEWNFPWPAAEPLPAEIVRALESLDEPEALAAAQLFKKIPPDALRTEMRTDIRRLEAEFQCEKLRFFVCLDEGLLFGGSLSEPCREIELELISGDSRLFDAAASAVKKYFALEDGTESKFLRCLNLLERSQKL